MTVQQITSMIPQAKVNEVYNARDGKFSAVTWTLLDDAELDSVGLTSEYIDELYIQVTCDANDCPKEISVRMSADPETYDREKVFAARHALYRVIKKILLFHGTDFEKPSREVFANTMEIGHTPIQCSKIFSNAQATIQTFDTLGEEIKKTFQFEPPKE